MGRLQEPIAGSFRWARNSSLALDGVTVPKHPEWGALSGIVTASAESPGVLFSTSSFSVLSGPCTVATGESCVGRPRGYLPNEICEIVVDGPGGLLGPCPIFDNGGGDFLITSGSEDCHVGGHNRCYDGHDCPAGSTLTIGQTLTWRSNEDNQGSFDNGWGGLPLSNNGLGGGWQVCFA